MMMAMDWRTLKRVKIYVFVAHDSQLYTYTVPAEVELDINTVIAEAVGYGAEVVNNVEAVGESHSAVIPGNLGVDPWADFLLDSPCPFPFLDEVVDAPPANEVMAPPVEEGSKPPA